MSGIKVVPHPFKLSNFGGVYESEEMINLERCNNDNSSATYWNLKMASDHQQEQGDGSITHNQTAVPFFDFLGVGIIS